MTWWTMDRSATIHLHQAQDGSCGARVAWARHASCSEGGMRLAMVSALLLAMACGCAPPDDDEEDGVAEADIVGGRRDTSRELDAVVAIGDDDRLLCSGVLVDPTHVVTVEHCFAHLSVDETVVRFGPDGLRPKQEIRAKAVDKITGEASVGFAGWGSDVAIVTLASAPRGVTPIPMLGRALGDADVNTRIVGVGYGQTVASTARDQPMRYRFVMEGYLAQLRGQPTRAPEAGSPVVGTRPLLDGYEAITRRTGNAYACVGDSGGPQLVRLANGGYRVVAIQSAVGSSDQKCQPWFSVIALFGPLVQAKRVALGIAAAP